MSADSGCLHIHLGLGTFFLFGDKETRPFNGFMVISDIYVMAIYHFYKDGKKTVYILAKALGLRPRGKAQLRPWRKGIRILDHRPLVVKSSLLVHART